LDRLRASAVDLVDIGSGVPLEAVRSVCQETTGPLWAVTQIGVLARGQDHTWTALTAKEGCPVQYAQCVAADPQGGVWVGTQYKGLYHWHRGEIPTNINKTNGLANDSVRALLPTAAGELWVGTESTDAQRPALQRRRADQWRTFELPPGSGPVIALTVDAAGHVWVATSAGRLLRVRQKPEALVDETASTLVVPQTIRCLLTTPDGSLWIGYAGRGVGRLKAGRFNQYRLEQGLADDYISQIVADGRGRLWFAGNRGIFQVQQREFDDLAGGRIKRLRSVVYGLGDGLPGLQASYGYWPGALRSTDGRLWIPMQSGLAVVQAANLKNNPLPPPVVIERVIVDGQSVAAYDSSDPPAAPGASERLDLRQPEPHLRLRPGHQQVQLEFTALSFAAPANVGFKYRLHGLDQDWVDAGGRRVAYYPHLPPGEYRFQVIACNNDGLWNEAGAALALTAEPHFYETAWFRVVGPVAAFVLVGGGVLLAVRRRHWRQIELLQLQRATERERARIAQDLHDDLGAGLTQISLNTVMAQNPAVTPEVAGGLLHEIDQRARELVTALDEIVWAVNPKNDTLPSLARYFCQFAQSYLQPGGMACRLEVAPVLPDAPVSAEQRHHLFLTLKEALHNVLQHSRATEIRLAIAADAQMLTVTLADNGRGFTSAPVPEGADGLHNMANRLAVLGGRCVVTSASGQGTTVVLRLPLDGTRL
jgi:signal transduction histidine kinase/streptogramin lyase